MGLFDKMKNKAQELKDNIKEEYFDDDEEKKEELKEEDSVEEIEEVQNEDEEDIDDDEEEEDDTNVTKMPVGWDQYSEEEILGKIAVVALEYSQRGDDVNYLKEEGFENEDHLMGFKTHFETSLAEKRGISLYDIMGLSQQAMQKQMLKNADGMKDEGGVMEPVEGISCEDWAKASAALASGKSQDEAIAMIGVDLAKWDIVNNEWTTRMSNDQTFTITQVYSNAFTASATGNLGGAGDFNEENFPYEKWLEIGVAQDKLTSQGKDPQQVLASIGLTVTDWSTGSAYWAQKMATDYEKYIKEDNRLRPIYEEKYKAGSVHDDIEF